MKRSIWLCSLATFFLAPFILFAQNNNGQLDDLDELSTLYTIPVEMPDGVSLMTDIYLPITQDAQRVTLDWDDIVPFNLGLGSTEIELIPNETRLWYYDSLYQCVNGEIVSSQPNPNPTAYPLLFTRTPYNKQGDITGRIVSIFGYAYAMQDMRGRYSSEGVYLPMYSDSWDKSVYHNDHGHVLDVLPLNDPSNGNFHVDGANSVQWFVDNLMQPFDLDGDGTLDPAVTNGSIGMFGASALGNTQYQAAASYKIDPTGPGLKCLLPIVATNEHYRFTGYQNGVFRDRIVTGWLRGQILSGTDDEFWNTDLDIQNNVHTSRDYGLPNKFLAANNAIDHFVEIRYGNSNAGYYPNSIGRGDMDGTFAPVDANGIGDPNGQFSRYTNMEVPAYHLTGWWDIFTDGQIETWRLMKEHLSPMFNNYKLQKLVIGPWAHQTIGSTTTGDMIYPDNVADIIGIDVEGLDINNLDIDKVIHSEIISWFRYNLNYNEYSCIGEPTAKIPESQTWQKIGSIFGSDINVRIPSETVELSFEGLVNFVNGTGGLENVSFEIAYPSLQGYDTSTVTIPELTAMDINGGEPLIDDLPGGTEPIDAYNKINFLDANVPDVRFYVIGPNDDGLAENANTGNYWKGADEFPISNGITKKMFFLHQDGRIDRTPPQWDEGYKIYVHDPNDPVLTVGGGNMIVRTPQGDRDAQGQMLMSDPDFAPYTMDRPGVIKFETATLNDSLCIIGFPKMKMWAKTNPDGLTDGLTDTDFFIRVLDVYPDGREYFVVEGAVNGRAKDYARSLVDGEETMADANIPFTNLNIGELNEYEFLLMPIAYTFGKGHKMKVLISSSNFTRYQVNPNLPIMDGEFFRRKPGDGQNYVFEGNEMEPRIAVQRVAFSDQYPTHIELPVFDSRVTSTDNISPQADAFEVMVFPNPAQQDVYVYFSKQGDYLLSIRNLLGQQVYNGAIDMQGRVDVSGFESGVYVLEMIDQNSGERVTRKLQVQ